MIYLIKSDPVLGKGIKCMKVVERERRRSPIRSSIFITWRVSHRHWEQQSLTILFCLDRMEYLGTHDASIGLQKYLVIYFILQVSISMHLCIVSQYLWGQYCLLSSFLFLFFHGIKLNKVSMILWQPAFISRSFVSQVFGMSRKYIQWCRYCALSINASRVMSRVAKYIF
ncbi:hypothetical protein F4703DRAFT_1916313, partial [Phycomyces blakesleeanus]